MKLKKIAKAPRNNDKTLREFLPRFYVLGAKKVKIISPSDVLTAAWVRWKCQFGCGGYASSLMCPPHTLRPDDTRKMLNDYKRAFQFESASGNAKKIAAQIEREIFLSGYYKSLGLGSGPSCLCRSCSFANGCQHPDDAPPSIEACGICVFATARKHRFPINGVKKYNDPQHYFGLVLVE